MVSCFCHFQGTLVMVLKLSEARIPTVSSSIEKLELFSCYLRNEEETALSILDPVTVSVELTEATPTSKLPVQQVIDVNIYGVIDDYVIGDDIIMMSL